MALPAACCTHTKIISRHHSVSIVYSSPFIVLRSIVVMYSIAVSMGMACATAGSRQRRGNMQCRFMGVCPGPQGVLQAAASAYLPAIQALGMGLGEGKHVAAVLLDKGVQVISLALRDGVVHVGQEGVQAASLEGGLRVGG